MVDTGTVARPHGSGDDADVLDLGGDRRGARPARWSRWLLVPVVGVVVALGVAQAGRTGPAPRVPAPSPSTADPGAFPPGAGRSAPPITVTTLGHSLLGATTDWELFGRGAGEVVRIELARGRVIRTTVPVLLSDAPVSFVVTADRALVRSLDRVPGYVVRDGQPAHPLPPALSQGGPAFPGPAFPAPDPGAVWVPSGDSPRTVMMLRGVDDGRDRTWIPVPEGDSAFEAISDAAGYLVFRATGGMYDATPAGLRRITTGSLLAVGATRWLALECDDRHRCVPVVIDRATGSRRTLRTASPSSTAPRGVIAPDGGTAVIFRVAGDGTVIPYLLDLVTGATRPIGPPIDRTVGEGSMVWSPDSRWLFAAGADGAIYVVDPATADVVPLGVSLQALSQLAVRPAGGT
jgi:hypothetical protein